MKLWMAVVRVGDMEPERKLDPDKVIGPTLSYEPLGDGKTWRIRGTEAEVRGCVEELRWPIVEEIHELEGD